MSPQVRLARAVIAGLGVGFGYSIGVAALSGRLMAVALRRAERSPELGRLDPWGADALGIGVYNLALTAVPATRQEPFRRQSARSGWDGSMKRQSNTEFARPVLLRSETRAARR